MARSFSKIFLYTDLGFASWQVDDGVHGPRRSGLRRRVSPPRIPTGFFFARQNGQLLGLGVIRQNLKLGQGHWTNQVIMSLPPLPGPAFLSHSPLSSWLHRAFSCSFEHYLLFEQIFISSHFCEMKLIDLLKNGLFQVRAIFACFAQILLFAVRPICSKQADIARKKQYLLKSKYCSNELEKDHYQILFKMIKIC